MSALTDKLAFNQDGAPVPHPVMGIINLLSRKLNPDLTGPSAPHGLDGNFSGGCIGQIPDHHNRSIDELAGVSARRFQKPVRYGSLRLGESGHTSARHPAA